MWTDAKDAKLTSLFKSGLRDEVIAARMDITKSAVRNRRYRLNLNLTREQQRYRKVTFWTPDRQAVLIDLFNAGYSDKAIAKAMGHPWKAVYKHRWKIGLVVSHERRIEHANEFHARRRADKAMPEIPNPKEDTPGQRAQGCSTGYGSYYEDDELEWFKAIDKYRQVFGTKHLNMADYLTIIKSLGYRRTRKTSEETAFEKGRQKLKEKRRFPTNADILSLLKKIGFRKCERPCQTSLNKAASSMAQEQPRQETPTDNSSSRPGAIPMTVLSPAELRLVANKLAADDKL